MNIFDRFVCGLIDRKSKSHFSVGEANVRCSIIIKYWFLGRDREPEFELYFLETQEWSTMNEGVHLLAVSSLVFIDLD